MGYDCSFSGTIESRTLNLAEATELCRIFEDFLGHKLDPEKSETHLGDPFLGFKSQKTDGGYILSFFFDGSSGYNEEHTYSLLARMAQYLKSGNIEYAGEDDEHRRHIFSGDVWLESNGYIAYKPGRPIAPQTEKSPAPVPKDLYQVCVSGEYLRDTEVASPGDWDEFVLAEAASDIEGLEFGGDRFWEEACQDDTLWTEADAAPMLVGLYFATSEEEAKKTASDETGYDARLFTALNVSRIVREEELFRHHKAEFAERFKEDLDKISKKLKEELVLTEREELELTERVELELEQVPLEDIENYLNALKDDIGVLPNLDWDEDVSFYFNCLDAFVGVRDHNSLYQKYFADLFRDFEKAMGNLHCHFYEEA